MKIQTIEMHTAGEPLRVIQSGLPKINGKTILEKRRFFMENFDYIRTGLMLEPRGHADMYGAILTEPTTPDGNVGVFFIHNEGYSTMCGHAIIALTRLVVETGMVSIKGNEPLVLFDAPPGRIESRAKMHGENVREVSFRNVPSFLLLRDKKIEVDGLGPINFDVAYGGAFYAVVDAAQCGFSLIPEEYNILIDYGRKIKEAVRKNFQVTHPFEKDLGFLYGTIFTGAPEDPGNHSRNVCIFADGEVDRSPTGTGLSARAALHFAKGDMNGGDKFTIESILGTTMDVEITNTVNYGGFDAVIPQVTGKAFFTGTNLFFFDPEDPLKDGFIFR